MVIADNRASKLAIELPERVASYHKTDRVSYPRISQVKSTPEPRTPLARPSRVEMDSRWALARSVRALVAERDALKETLETGQCGISHVARTGHRADGLKPTPMTPS